MARKIMRVTVVTDQIWILRRSCSKRWVKIPQTPTGPTVSATPADSNLQPASHVLWNTWDSVRKLLKGLQK